MARTRRQQVRLDEQTERAVRELARRWGAARAAAWPEFSGELSFAEVVRESLRRSVEQEFGKDKLGA